MKNIAITSALALILFISCNRSEYSKSYHFDDENWKADNMLQYRFDINDTYERYNLYINVRNSDVYAYANIFMFVHFIYPDNTIAVDTVEGTLADAKGKWLGSGSGKYKNNKFLYKPNISFPQKGTYLFTIEQAMRIESLNGIASVGLELEKIKAE
jgi:gliding motility-associated lipoprotein GldH